jgi:hypothetical protein
VDVLFLDKCVYCGIVEKVWGGVEIGGDCLKTRFFRVFGGNGRRKTVLFLFLFFRIFFEHDLIFGCFRSNCRM